MFLRSPSGTEAGVLDDAAVGGHGVARFQQDDVAGHDLGGVQRLGLAVAQNLAGGGGHGLQRFDGGFGLALLEDAEDGVEQHDDEDDDDLGHALAADDAGHGRNGGRAQQQDQHRVLELVQETLEQGSFFSLLEFVGAVLRKALGRLLRAQTFGGRVLLLQYLLRGQFIAFQCGSPFLLPGPAAGQGGAGPTVFGCFIY